MSTTQLTAEWEQSIKEWARSEAATETDTFNEDRYCGLIDGAWEYATQLVAAQERITTLESYLDRIATGAQPFNNAQAWSWIETARQLANEALSPNTVVI